MPHFLHPQTIDDTRKFTLAEAHRAVLTLIRQVTNRSRDECVALPGIVGLDELIRRLVTAFLIGEHCLIEGMPGLVKTELSKTLASMLGLVFRRIQFTSDILPSDLIGREQLMNETEEGTARVRWQPGPIFTNILLADEINRASPKVQSALLEACEERQVTPMGRRTVRIRPQGQVDEQKIIAESGCYGFAMAKSCPPESDRHLAPERLQHFMVLATMNPIELEGVFPLSEAQVDRFGFKLLVDYPAHEHLRKIQAHAFEHVRVTEAHRPDEHRRTLYFLAALRDKLLGAERESRWMHEGNKVREDCELLVNFTHLRRIGRDEDTDLGDLAEAPSAKHEELSGIIVSWLTSGDPGNRERARRLQHWRAASDYPDVRNGASPRGLLKLVRAVHAEAFLDGSFDGETLRPQWKHVLRVAPDVLRHRVRLSGALAGPDADIAHFIGRLVEVLHVDR